MQTSLCRVLVPKGQQRREFCPVVNDTLGCLITSVHVKMNCGRAGRQLAQETMGKHFTASVMHALAAHS